MARDLLAVQALTVASELAFSTSGVDRVQQKYRWRSDIRRREETYIAREEVDVRDITSSILLYPRGASNVCCALCNAVTSVPPPGMEMDQLICGGCRTLLMYTRGATSVRCSCCHTVNLAPVANQVAQVNCGNCRMLLMYPYGAPSVKCAVCHYITNVNMSNGRVPIPMRPNGTATSGPMPPISTVKKKETNLVTLETKSSCLLIHGLVASFSFHYMHNLCLGYFTLEYKSSGYYIIETYVLMMPLITCLVSQQMSNGRVPIPMRPNGTATSGPMPPISTTTPPSHNHTVVVENPMSVDESGKLVSNVVVGVTTEKKAIK
ncbi:LSD1-like protein [Tanacetum coccineum]